ncbi:MAG: hypothetical protein DMF20_00510 [Verrucomicrobia bacterium]|nr:MAG: hypothetical protein DMF20_00510 [Verrucomicrobiota bacterium]
MCANNRHWSGKNPQPDRQSAHPKLWRRCDTSPIVDPMFRVATWCAARRAATRKKRPAFLDKNDRERASIRQMTGASCASRAVNSAQFLTDDSFPRHHISRSRSRLLDFETFPNHPARLHPGDIEEDSYRIFGPKPRRNKREQLQGPARRDFASVRPT